MKKHFRGMTLAAILLSASTSARADNNEYVPEGDLPQAFVGDQAHVGDDAARTGRSFVGDSSVQPSAYVGSETRSPVEPIRGFAPVTVGDLQPTGFTHPGSIGSACVGCDNPSCDDPGCDGFGCDSMYGRKRGKCGRLLDLCGKDGWGSVEAMLMFMAKRDSPALVTSADPGEFPVLPDATVEFGDDLAGELSAGVRVDLGRYLTDHFGIGGRFLWISENGGDYSAQGDQTDPNGRSIGRPYFFVPTVNPGVAGPDAEIVSQFGLFSGAVEAEYETEFWMAEAYGRLTFCKNKNSRLEMIGGFTYAQLDDLIQIASVTGDLNDQTLATTAFGSRFDTENQFTGGQIGMESIINRGRWTARALTKVHLGNMEQTVTIEGQTIDTLGGQVVSTSNSSLLVGEDQGTETRDEFTFIPELDLSLGYRFRDHVSFTVGYTFMYLDNVAMAGNHINVYRDTSDLGDPVVPAGFDIVDGNHWIQGISLGARIDY